MFRHIFISSIALVLLLGFQPINADKIECTDNTGTYDWRDTGHGDNSPSDWEDELNELSFCQVAMEVDHMNLDGEVEEDSNFDMEDLQETKAWDTALPTQKMCVIDSYENSPNDNGKDHFAAYEILYVVDNDECQEEA